MAHLCTWLLLHCSATAGLYINETGISKNELSVAYPINTRNPEKRDP